jgi:hypothetical protein
MPPNCVEHDVYAHILAAAITPVQHMLVRWLCSGQIDDAYEEVRAARTSVHTRAVLYLLQNERRLVGQVCRARAHGTGLHRCTDCAEGVVFGFGYFWQVNRFCV